MQGTNTAKEIPMVETVESLENAIKNLANTDGVENQYIEMPDLDVNKIIIDNQRIHDLIEETFASLSEVNFDQKLSEEWLDMQRSQAKKHIRQSGEDYAKFKRDAQKEVNYLVKEFERRKSAGAYARATTCLLYTSDAADE